MKGTGYGRILNMTSIMSHVSLPGRTAYSSSKAALLGLTRALALELADEAITVNGISPGPFGTEMNTPLMQNPELNAQFVANIPLGRRGKVEEIGALACYLCSEDAGFITGTDILIDGGWTAKLGARSIRISKNGSRRAPRAPDWKLAHGAGKLVQGETKKWSQFGCNGIRFRTIRAASILQKYL